MSLFSFEQRPGERNINGRFPYQVAFRFADSGTIELMDNYCSARFMPHRTRRDMRGRLRYCFASPTLADEVADAFGGDRIDVATKESPDGRIRPGY